MPEVDFNLELGQCHLRGNFGNIMASRIEVGRSSYSVNVTSYCPLVQKTTVPVSLAFRSLLSVTSCQVNLSSSLRADNQDLSLELSQSCRTPHLSGTLTHSFLGLRSQGLPQIITIEAVAPEDTEQAVGLLIKAGTCNVRVSRVAQARGKSRWLWALESACPLLQAHLNGSVWQDHQGIWSTMSEIDLKGGRVFLRLDAKPWPELKFEGELSHDIPALRSLPKSSRLRITSKSQKLRHDAELLLVMEKCAVRTSGTVMSHPDLQGSLLYHNNCTIVQEWGSPDRVQASGSLVVSPAFVDSHVSMVIDDTELQALLALKKTKDQNEASLNLNHSVPMLKKLGFPVSAALTINSGSHNKGSYFFIVNSSVENQKLSKEMIVAKTTEAVRVKSDFRHTVNYLKQLGVPANNNIQVELGVAEGKEWTLQAHCGDDRAGLRLHMKRSPLNNEIRGSIWHSWSWLHDQGLPLNIEGLCFIQGTLPRLQSRAQLSVGGHKLLTSGLNVSGTDGHLAALFSYSPLNQTRTQHNLDTILIAQFKGPLRSVSIDVASQDWRIRVVGDVGGWGTRGGTKEARVTLKHTIQGKPSPALQVEAWGRLTESQLRCSMAINPELSSSLALIIQGHHVPHSKDLVVKVVHNIPRMLIYLPSQLNVRSQLNQSESSVAGLVEISSGRRRLWALGELVATESGYRQAVEMKHTYPQLRRLPRTVAVRTMYEARIWNYQVQQAALWGNHEFSLSGLYSAPPALEMGNQTLKIQINCIPRLTSLDLMLERSLHGRQDRVLLGWTRHGQLEQVRALSAWSRSEERNETKMELKQPFSSTMRQLSLHTLSHSSQSEQRSNHQTHLSWDSAAPVNVSVSLDKQWQSNSSRGQACVLLSAQQMVKGCVSVGREGNSYSQNAELRWDNRSIKQSLKYQKSLRGMHSLQVHIGLDRVSPVPCPSHTLLAKVQTNLRDRLEHMVLLGVCPQQPTLSWSGSHRLNSAEQLFYTQSRLSVTGPPYQCSFTLALTNSSTAQTNMSLFSEYRMGNWSVELGGSAVSWTHGSGLQLQTTLDHREKIWLNGTLKGRCLQTTADPTLSEDLSVAVCMEADHSFKMNVRRRDNSNKSETLGSLSVGAANQRLTLRARGCLQSLTSAEDWLHYLSFQMLNKLAERIKTLKRLLIEFRKQGRDSQLLQELSDVPLHVSRRVEALLEHGDRDVLALWHRSHIRHMVIHSLPRFLSQLQNASLLGQQELRRPLATLAGVYQDVKGQSLDVIWREYVWMWTERLVDVLPVLLENSHLRLLSQTGVTALRAVLDAAGQHTYHWTETRLATALSGVRKQLASLYTFSPRECTVTVSVPLPPFTSKKMAEAGLVEILLEEWFLRPLQALASIRPTAEFYHLKRKMMDSPFIHQALLVADQFVVTFDGHLYELPGSCPMLLTQDVSSDASFVLLLRPDPQSLLLIHMSNSSIDVQRSGQFPLSQVTADCTNAVTHTFHSDTGLTVKREPNILQVSNQNGGSVSCDLSLEVCSFTLDRYLHGVSTGLLGTNDNDAGNDFPLHDGSQAKTLEDFFTSWQLRPKCSSPSEREEDFSKAAMSPVSCNFLFTSPDSPLSSCFRVVDPGQFLSVCELSSSRAPCRLASAFVHLCQQNYIPVEVPVQCKKV
ncbi:uncharacterized protein LOC121644668 isoform X2 [Melanotaenia boesemani]|uniref:uncharacterized protein LOC121644668 isoform X2 n=1 Tax=Melanotaenia boesemani TaxID=1250792 RepID=UPI001C05C155|nr:uncharacterized protein LOC121644668 isoform X2 [Melanotaenia boesemani]